MLLTGEDFPLLFVLLCHLLTNCDESGKVKLVFSTYLLLGEKKNEEEDFSADSGAGNGAASVPCV